MSLAAYGRELGLNIHSYGSVLTGVMTGGTLGLDVERALPSVVGTTCTPSTFVAVEFGPGGAAADEGREPGVPFEADAETAALDAVEGRAEVDTELEPEAVASTAGEVAVRVPEVLQDRRARRPWPLSVHLRRYFRMSLRERPEEYPLGELLSCLS